MRFGLDVMSRLHRTSVPDVVAQAIRDAFDFEVARSLDFPPAASGGPRKLLNLLWAAEPSERFANLGFHCPELMTSGESRLWAVIKADPRFWHAQGDRSPDGLLRDALALDYEDLCAQQQAV